MKNFIIFLSLLGVVFSSSAGISLAYDATGIWNYTESNLQHNCPLTPYDLGNGELGILQTGSSSFLGIADDWSNQGSVSGATYTITDSWCDVYDSTLVSIDSAVSFTLTSSTAGSGSVNFTATWSGGSCSGSHQLTISRPTPVTPVHDATGRWNFTLSNISYNCGDGPEQISGYFDVTQTDNKITAVDNLGHEHNGFVNGTQYSVLRSYLQNGGRTTDWARVTLSSATQGAGEAGFVWDDDSDNCSGNGYISMNKVTHTITASAGPGGSISPSGSVSVEQGTTQYFWFTPDKGYMVVSILLDGELYEAKNWPGCYIENVDADHTLKVIFERIRVMPWIPLLLLDD